MYAIIETGGKQYNVAPGQTIDVGRLGAQAGETLVLERVLMVADGEKKLIGQPMVPGGKVTATVLGEVRGDKVIVFKYKPKVRYDKKTGHRQHYTRITINDISWEGAAPASAEASAPTRRRRTRAKASVPVVEMEQGEAGKVEGGADGA
ncbi:MAG: 50S ribosomal protein L21 [Chloroflexi bacterium]|nr:50S ribosomal protein L21 [Chloroflexota bacterium]